MNAKELGQAAVYIAIQATAFWLPPWFAWFTFVVGAASLIGLGALNAERRTNEVLKAMPKPGYDGGDE